MLTISHLTKTYGDKKAVDDLSLHIAPGEICGFIGHNGAGKTTTLKAVTGILPFDKGEITVCGTSIRECLPKGGAVVALCIEGKPCSSEELSRRMADFGVQGKTQITFLIGGSVGLSEDVKKLADWRLSMSPMTFPHHMARIMLLEQLYRAYQIAAGTKYHK